ncbi:MAG: aminotransferase, partial [Candidatus Bathyarchaeia archaeon]
MSERFKLMAPGPTNIDPAVMRAMIRTTESHMGEPFGRRFRSVLDKLKQVMAVEGEAIAIAGSGTLAQEIAVANLVKPGDRVLNLVTGFFSERFVDITKRLGGEAHPLKVPWG